MSARGGIAAWPGLSPEALTEWLWVGGGCPEDCTAGVEAAIADGARHGEVARALRVLARAGLVLDRVAQAVCARWPASVDMAVLAVDLSSPSEREAAFAVLSERVAAAPERAAAQARARRRHGHVSDARGVLAGSDRDRALQAALALDALALEEAALHIAALGAEGAALGARLVWLRDGAAALAEHAKEQGRGTAAFWAAMFRIWMAEQDLTCAQAALAAWRDLGGDASALHRAELRLMLERGSADAVRDVLAAGLDMSAPWRWDAADHMLWLRSGLACAAPAADLARHAASAHRLFARHNGLLHLHFLCREAACDWRVLVPGAMLDATPEQSLAVARADLRIGLPARALGRIRVALRCCDAEDAALRQRLWATRAEALMRAGRLDAAAAVLERAAPVGAPAAADFAALQAELALMRRQPGAALAVLDPVMSRSSARPALWVLRARAEFARGAFAAAQAALSARSELTGQAAAADPRARLVADAQTPARSAGWAAHMLVQRALWPFVPGGGGAIPRQLIHYWEGPESPALARSRARWAALHPGFAQRVFDAAQALHWLRARGFDTLAARFAALPGPALRADLFRLCIILQEGGVFADLDEYPRLPVTPWLERADCVLCIERGFGTVANNFIAAAPGQALIAQALEHACAALEATARPCPWWDTGPAQLARAVAARMRADAPPPGVRLLSQEAYDRRVSTNLPWPHKRGAEHWRNAAPVDSIPGTA
ncbi:hypothetical protein HUK65_04385 [Rhodobacteraceae bacterium 2376]|uniref:Glycosyl transferase-like sugar-binding protein n=1 Tax=Rhabdonatronobacter sediminivivens TaxID=2743469 RepID=A0A7Z0HXT9_9RHOB|nr:glycosyltransferase [Rhabdonatronobacter sediminivivens]NYS24222.1 hypothetical protein [Rhabdonatronobacter sediminivivens]